MIPTPSVDQSLGTMKSEGDSDDPQQFLLVPFEDELNTTSVGDINQSYDVRLTGVVAPEAVLHHEQIWTPEVIFRVSTITCVMCLTLVGNISLISIIGCYASLRRKRVSVFLLNLAFGDLMVCFVTMTTEILFEAFGQWVLGAIACKIIVYGQIVTLASTTFLLTAMSIDRYQVLVQPLQSLRGSPRIWKKMLLSWMLALIFATPQLFIFVETKDILPDGQTILTCKSAGYTSKWQRKVYFSFMTAYILVIPTAIMSFCYCSIIRVVWMRAGGRDIDTPKIHFVTSHKSTAAAAVDINTVESSSHRVAIPPKLAMTSKRTVIKMTLSVIVGFVVCWTPYFVVNLIRIFSDYSIELTHVLAISKIMALVHSALNPILYMVFSKRKVKVSCWQMRKSVGCGQRKRPRMSPDGSIVYQSHPVKYTGLQMCNRNKSDVDLGRDAMCRRSVSRLRGRRVFLSYTRQFLRGNEPQLSRSNGIGSQSSSSNAAMSSSQAGYLQSTGSRSTHRLSTPMTELIERSSEQHRQQNLGQEIV